MTSAEDGPGPRLPPFLGAVLGAMFAWLVAELWLSAYTDALHALAAVAGLSAGSMAGLAVSAFIFKHSPQGRTG